MRAQRAAIGRGRFDPVDGCAKRMTMGARVRKDVRVLTVEDRRRTVSKSVGSRDKGS
jgi:hypothetical protein